jgi:uncharacterized membrane protein
MVAVAAVTGANSPMPDWILSVAYTLHMLATVLWVGGLVFQSLFLLPMLTSNSLEFGARDKLTFLQTRFQPIAWLCLAILFGTGLTQMTGHPQYEGLLAIQNRWSVAILIKHLSIVPMLGITAFQSFFLHPGLQRELLKAKHADTSHGASKALRTERQLVMTNVLFSIIVLALTAIARTS